MGLFPVLRLYHPNIKKKKKTNVVLNECAFYSNFLFLETT